MKWYVLEWNALDDRIDLDEWESCQTDVAGAYEEISEGLHNYSSVLVMDSIQLQNLFAAVDSLRLKLAAEESLEEEVKGGGQEHG